MKLPTQHAARVGKVYVERDPGEYEGRHRLDPNGHAKQFYPGCPSCMWEAES